MANQIKLGIKENKSKNESHPPQKRITLVLLIISILAYSPKEKRAKLIPEYSTLYPETNSASASGKSKGCLLVSAKEQIKKIIAKNGKKIPNHIPFS